MESTGTLTNNHKTSIFANLNNILLCNSSQYKISQNDLYQQAGGPQGAGFDPSQAGGPQGTAPNGQDYYDADYTVVDDDHQ